MLPPDFSWLPTTEERYHDMLEVLPPAAMMRGAFLVGEAQDHLSDDGSPRFTVYRYFRSAGEYAVGSRPITVAEFEAL